MTMPHLIERNFGPICHNIDRQSHVLIPNTEITQQQQTKSKNERKKEEEEDEEEKNRNSVAIQDTTGSSCSNQAVTSAHVVSQVSRGHPS